MSAPTRPGRGRVITLTILGAALVAGLLWLDRGSLERGNRLFRSGELRSAAELYVDRSGSAGDLAAAYNAGTAELALDEETAEERLRSAAGAADPAIASRAEHNLAYLFLSRVRGDTPPDTAITLLQASIASARTALRLDPMLEDARWNLALAQARLDSLTQTRLDPRQQETPGEDETPVDLDSLTRGVGDARSGIEPEDAAASENLGRRLAAAQGAREAWAAQDPGPLSADAARALLRQVATDPEQLIRGLIWSQRPDVAWWNAEPYPGGAW